MTDFLEVIEAEEAHRRFQDALPSVPLGVEEVPLDQALGRILAEDIPSPVDVPGFDRSNVDGFAVRAADTFGADEATPRRLQVNGESISPGRAPTITVEAGTATPIATGGMLPRGADTVVMIEHALREGETVVVQKAGVPGGRISFAGSDLVRGEIVARRGARLTARETGTLAAVGLATVPVHRRPRVAIFSTGNEIIAPGEAIEPGQIFDSNQRILSDSIRELGGEPVELGVVRDDPEALTHKIESALEHDVVILSGGTSKGEGDHGPAAVRALGEIVCHGVAVKPGKPICLAVVQEKPVVILPGFPTSAVFTFHEFVAPILRRLTGARPDPAGTVTARVPLRLTSERGRTEFVLVSLVESPAGLAAYPMGKGSGSITTFSKADGFITVPRQQEYLEADEMVEVQLLGRDVRPADLVFIGSHCVGVEHLLSRLTDEGMRCKAIFVGSQGGLLALERGECDVAGIHLCDETGTYNTPFIDEDLRLIPGYGRTQGIVYRDEEPPLATSQMINRNRGSGTRVVIDEILGETRPPGYHLEARSHNAVAAAVAQGRADWGMAIESVARAYGLGFRPVREERYDLIVARTNSTRPALARIESLVADENVRTHWTAAGLLP